jgi:hypothetical protein
MTHQKSRQHPPRARWRPAGCARAAPAPPRGPTAGNPAWGPACRRGCPSGSAAHRGPRSRWAVPSIGLAAGVRIVQAPGLPPAPAPGACRAAMQGGAGHGPQFVAAASSRTGARRFIHARGHIYLAPGTTVPVVVRARRTPQCPPLRYTSTAISPTAKSQNFCFTHSTNLGVPTLSTV